MGQFDLVQSIKDSLDPLYCLTHPDMDEWNYCESRPISQRVSGLIMPEYIYNIKSSKNPQTATEAMMLEQCKHFNGFCVKSWRVDV